VRVFLEATSEANETMSGANSQYGQSGKEAMNGCRRDLELSRQDLYGTIFYVEQGITPKTALQS
jgi:hypothetical protein